MLTGHFAPKEKYYIIILFFFKAIFHSNAEILANLIVLHMYILSHYLYVCSHIDFQAGGACKYDVVVLLRRHQSIQILPRQMGKKIAS